MFDKSFPTLKKTSSQPDTEAYDYLKESITKSPYLMDMLIREGKIDFKLGDGLSPKSAVIVTSYRPAFGIAAIYQWITEHFGAHRSNANDAAVKTGWRLISVKSEIHDCKHFNVMDLVLADGSSQSIYFDVTCWCKPDPSLVLLVLTAHNIYQQTFFPSGAVH